jgi:hypothetical protein
VRRVGSNDGRASPGPPDRPIPTDATASSDRRGGRSFQTGLLSLPRVGAACFPRREAAPRVDAQSGEEQAAQSGLSTGQGPSPGASQVPIGQATPRSDGPEEGVRTSGPEATRRRLLTVTPCPRRERGALVLHMLGVYL